MRKLQSIIAQVLGVDREEINEDSSPDTIESWDSLNGLMMFSELENKFKIKFNASEVLNIRNVKDIKKALLKHGVKPNQF